MSAVRVSDIERAIASRFPLQHAEEWDRVGLLAGDPDATVTGVVLALDPTRAVVAHAVAHSANVVVTHHPAFLKAPQWLTPGRGSAGVVFDALSARVALINAHTNLDRAPEAAGLLPGVLGLTPVRPIERSTMPMTLITVFTPESHADRVAEAMVGAGAGRVGDYEGCRFTVQGMGGFTPPPGSNPYVGRPGEAAGVAEVRIEMVAPRSRARGVVSAAASAHPYEEPLIVASEVAIARNAARLGQLCRVPEAGGTSLADLVARCRAAFGVTPRVWGPPEARIELVATATGSAGSMLGDALARGAQALVAGEVRYHDALEAVESGLCVVELGHDVSEWPLVALLEDAVRSVEGLDPSSVHVLPAAAGWWTP